MKVEQSKIEMFYIFNSTISPNTASGNRFLAFLKGFEELGIETTAVLYKPSYEHYHIPQIYSHIRVVELWKDWPFCRRIIDKIYSKLSLRRFLRKIMENDIVFVYGSPEYLHIFMDISGINVYNERTEHPELYSSKIQNLYLPACLKVKGLFVISTALKNYFISKGFPASKITIVNIIVDHDRFNNLEMVNNSCDRVISYCGTASNNKDGVDQLIKAFAIVSEKYKDVKLQIIGKAPSKCDESDNLRLVKFLGVEDKVIFTGIIPADKMPQMLVDSTILALDRPDSLQAQSGFPTKLGEYLLSGRPVVITKVGDIPLFLKDCDNALLAEERNPENFAAKIIWALEHPVDADRIGREGKKAAEKYFNYKTESRKIVDVIFNKNNL